MKKKLQDRILEAVSYLEQISFDEVDGKKVEVDEDFYFFAQTFETKSSENALFEVHQNYVDIQYIVEGCEQIQTAAREGMEVAIPYDQEKDIGFYHDPGQTATFVLKAGSYAILYPKDAHRPGICVGKPSMVKKIVGKIRVKDGTQQLHG